jgi:Protein of unknown function, DUF488.
MTPVDKPMGSLFTSNGNGLRNLKVEAEIWQITRAGIQLPNSILVRGLAPSTELFETYLNEWKGIPSKDWWPEYESRFLDELKTDEKLNCLRELYRSLRSGINIVLVCFCKDYNYCHRKLVAEFFKQYELIAEELDPIKHEQLILFS